MPHTDKRQQIMHAAEKLFSSRRFHEITLDDVVREAGVGKGTVYRYFQDKDDLFFQAATSGFDDLCELLHRKVPEQAPFSQQLLNACVEISRFFDRRRQLFRMMHAEEGRMLGCQTSLRHRWMQRRKNLVSALAAILAKGVAEGRIRKDIPPEILGNFLLGLLRSRARDLAEAPASLQRHEVVLDFFCRGAAPPARVTEEPNAQDAELPAIPW